MMVWKYFEGLFADGALRLEACNRYRKPTSSFHGWESLFLNSEYLLEDIIAQHYVQSLPQPRAVVLLADLHDDVRSDAFVCILKQPLPAGPVGNIRMVHQMYFPHLRQQAGHFLLRHA